MSTTSGYFGRQFISEREKELLIAGNKIKITAFDGSNPEIGRVECLMCDSGDIRGRITSLKRTDRFLGHIPEYELELEPVGD